MIAELTGSRKIIKIGNSFPAKDQTRGEQHAPQDQRATCRFNVWHDSMVWIFQNSLAFSRFLAELLAAILLENLSVEKTQTYWALLVSCIDLARIRDLLPRYVRGQVQYLVEDRLLLDREETRSRRFGGARKCSDKNGGSSFG